MNDVKQTSWMIHEMNRQQTSWMIYEVNRQQRYKNFRLQVKTIHKKKEERLFIYDLITHARVVIG